MQSVIPAEIELIGGPYCGIILHPSAGCIHTVLERLSEPEQIGWTGAVTPTEGDWLEPGLVLIGGRQLGDALYRMESERRWQYVPMETSLA